MTISSWSDLNRSSIKLFNNTLIRPVPSSNQRPIPGSNHRYLPLASSLSKNNAAFQKPSLSKNNDEIEVIDINKSSPPAQKLSASERRWAKLEKEDEIGNLDKLLDPNVTSKPFFSQVDAIVQEELRKIKEGISNTPDSIKESDPIADSSSEKKDEKPDPIKNSNSTKDSEVNIKQPEKKDYTIPNRNPPISVQQKNITTGQENKIKFVSVSSQQNNNSNKTRDVLALKPTLTEKKSNNNFSNRAKDPLKFVKPKAKNFEESSDEDTDDDKDDYKDSKPAPTIASTRSRRQVGKVDYTKEAPRSLGALEKEKANKKVEEEKKKLKISSKEDSDVEWDSHVDEDSRGSKIDMNRVTKELKANNLDIVPVKGSGKKSISKQDATKTVEESSDEDDDRGSNNVLNMLKDSIKHLSPPKNPPTNREAISNKLIPNRSNPLSHSRNNPPAPPRSSTMNISQFNDKRMVTVNRQNMINRSNIQSSLQRLKEQQQKPSSRSAEIISLDDDDEDDIVEVVKADTERMSRALKSVSTDIRPGGDERKSFSSPIISPTVTRKTIVPLKRKDPLSLSRDVSRERSPPRKRQEILLKAPEKQLAGNRSIERNVERERPTDRNNERQRSTDRNVERQRSTDRNFERQRQSSMPSNSSSNKNTSARQVAPPGSRKNAEVSKPTRSVEPKATMEKENNIVPERRTRASARQNSASRSDNKVVENKTDKNEQNKKAKSQDRSLSREPKAANKAKSTDRSLSREPKAANKADKDKKDDKKDETEKSAKVTKKSQKETKSAAEKKETSDKPSLLPDGWKRELAKRTRGATSDNPEIYIFSPEGRRFRSRKELEKYCKDNPKNKITKVNLDAVYELGDSEK